MDRYCTTCYGTNLTQHDAVLICEDCGAQLQLAVEEVEFQQGVTDARGRRALRATATHGTHDATAQLAAAAADSATNVRAAALAYARCLQLLLQDQCAALVARFGVNPAVAGVARALWLAHLAQSGLLEPGLGDRPLGAAAAAAAAGEGPRTVHGTAAGGGASAGGDEDAGGDADRGAVGGEDGGDAHADGGGVSAALSNDWQLRHRLWRALPPQTTLRIAFLACHYLREALGPMDLVAAALDGRLPFWDLPARGATLLAREGERTRLPVRCLQVGVADAPIRFLGRAWQLAQRLQLPLPLVNAPALLQRAVAELELPPAVLPVAQQLHQLHLEGSPLLSLDPKAQPQHAAHPYAQVGAVLVAALKMGMAMPAAHGGSPEARAGRSIGGCAPRVVEAPPDGWVAWAERQLLRLPGAGLRLMDTQQAAALPSEDAAEYLCFCRTHVFSGYQPAATLEELQLLLYSYVDAAAGGGARFPPIAGAATQPTPRRARGVLAMPAAATAAAADAGRADGSDGLQDPEDEGYLLMSGGQKTFRTPPAHAAALAAVSHYCHVSAETLAALVAELEQRMVEAESAVALLRAQPKPAAKRPPSPPSPPLKRARRSVRGADPGP